MWHNCAYVYVRTHSLFLVLHTVLQWQFVCYFENIPYVSLGAFSQTVCSETLLREMELVS